MNLLHMTRWFIDQEMNRALDNIRNGTIGKEQAAGSLSTLYQLAAAMEDRESMIEISKTIADLRNVQLNSRTSGTFEFKQKRDEHLQAGMGPVLS
jgi:hypothetical protein